MDISILRAPATRNLPKTRYSRQHKGYALPCLPPTDTADNDALRGGKVGVLSQSKMGRERNKEMAGAWLLLSSNNNVLQRHRTLELDSSGGEREREEDDVPNTWINANCGVRFE